MIVAILLIAAAVCALWYARPASRPSTGAGASADRRARELRTPLVRLATAVGISTQAEALAVRSRIGATGERLTAALVDPLRASGWQVLHDLEIPGSRANIDHLIVPPHGRYALVLDSKLWSKRTGAIIVLGGRMHHGTADRQRAVDTALWEAGRAAELLGVPVRTIIVMHSAPVPGGRLEVAGAVVVGGRGLLAELRGHAGRPDRARPDRARAERLAAKARRELPAKR